MDRRKVGTVPAKVDIEKQKQFKEKELEPRLAEAREGNRNVLFMDAAHFVLALFIGYLWSFGRLFIKSPSGRQRFNVLGAVDAVTHTMLTFENDSYINAQSVCELLDKISEAYKESGKPTTIVLDNARYQRCKLVFAKAEQLGIELLFLPPYSPNLNLIERVWKFTKKECLNSTYHENFNSFSSKISSFVGNMHTTHKADLQSLLSHKFQDFSKKEIRASG